MTEEENSPFLLRGSPEQKQVEEEEGEWVLIVPFRVLVCKYFRL